MPNIVLGFTGSVATILGYDLCHSLKKLGRVNTIWTEHAEFFIKKITRPWGDVEVTLSDEEVASLRQIKDEEEWEWHGRKSKVLHIEIRKDADVLVIAPCSAQTLAKLANGMADNLLTSVARCWDWKKPFLIAPAMNTHMLNHPITREHISKLESWGVKFIPTQSKVLACGDIGDGAMADIKVIHDTVAVALRRPNAG